MQLGKTETYGFGKTFLHMGSKIKINFVELSCECNSLITCLKKGLCLVLVKGA